MLIKNRASLLQTERSVLRVISRLRFATHSNVQYWTNEAHVSATARICSRLVDAELLEVHNDLRPFVYRLSRQGCRVLRQSYSKDWYSAPSIHQYVLRNTIEIELRKEQSDLQMIPRVLLLKMGLSSAIGEHAARYDVNRMAFILVDDYLMDSKRIARCWDRIHKASMKHYQPEDGSPAMSWRSLADRFLIFSTDMENLEVHRILVNKLELPAECRYIAPIWGSV